MLSPFAPPMLPLPLSDSEFIQKPTIVKQSIGGSKNSYPDFVS